MNFEKNRESNGESNVWCKTDGEKEDREPNGGVMIEENSGSDGVRWYGHVLRRDDEGLSVKKSVGMQSLTRLG